MPLIQKFTYTWPEGTTPIELNNWIKTLSKEEQDEYWEGRRNGDRLRQLAISEGRLVLHFPPGDSDGAYIWKDNESFSVGKENDPIWEKYWQRWMDETGVIFKIDLIEK
jgi:hypothetical protein